MFTEPVFHTPHVWHLITRLGEAQIVLPLALVGGLARVRPPDQRNLAIWWAALLALAVLITIATKVAFIGWGIGSAELDFTGVSGHAMLAAAVYPLATPALTGSATNGTRRLATALGAAVALLIGVSRLVLGVHSVSEVVAGWLVGGTACAAVLNKGAPTPIGIDRKAFLPVALLWIGVTLFAAPAMNTHALVTRLALDLSGHEHPYTRVAMKSAARRP